MDTACRNDKLALLKNTEPELLAMLVEIDRAKKALRGHSPATVPTRPAPNVSASGLPRHIVLFSASPGSARSVSSSLYGHDLTLHGCEELSRPGPQRTISAGTRTLKPFKTQNLTLCPRNPVPKSILTDEQKRQQLFLKRRAALYNPARPKSSNSLVSEYSTKSRRRRHHADDMEVSTPESLRDLKLWICMVHVALHITWLLTC
jgi:hypothetical protein